MIVCLLIHCCQEELNHMMTHLKKSGFDKAAVMQIFKERKAKFDQATEEYKRAENLVVTNL